MRVLSEMHLERLAGKPYSYRCVMSFVVRPVSSGVLWSCLKSIIYICYKLRMEIYRGSALHGASLNQNLPHPLGLTMADTLKSRTPTGGSVPLAPILRLPKDLLYKILSRLLPPFTPISGNRHPLLTFRQVCRIFRFVANKAPLWCTDDFDFSQILPHGKYAPPDFIRVLLTDRHLTYCIGEKKTVWKFRTFKRFRLIKARVPGFRKNAHTVGLLWGTARNDGTYAIACTNPFGDVVEKGGLDSVRGIRTLRMLDVPQVNFDDISRCLPALENLSVEYRHRKGYQKWSGSLATLSNLQSLSLVNIGYPDFDFDSSEDEDEVRKREEEVPSPGDPVPLNSAASLTHLQIVGEGHDVATLFAPSLDKFVNLTHLSLVSISDKIIAQIAVAEFRLREFRGKFWSGVKDVDGCLEMLLRAQALRDVESLELSFRGDFGDWFSVDTYFFTLQLMVTHLTKLQHVKLRMRLHVRMCGELSKLENLKSIVWVTDMVGHETGGRRINEKSIAEMNFDTAFVEFSEKPIVQIIIEEPDYDDVYDFDCFGGCDLGGVEVRPSIVGTGQVSSEFEL